MGFALVFWGLVALLRAGLVSVWVCLRVGLVDCVCGFWWVCCGSGLGLLWFLWCFACYGGFGFGQVFLFGWFCVGFACLAWRVGFVFDGVCVVYLLFW